MSESQAKKCPKCGGDMAAGDARVSHSAYGLRLAKFGDIVGDRIIPFYCTECGYIELYKEMKKKKDST